METEWKPKDVSTFTIWTEQQRQVMSLLFGVSRMTQAEVADELGITQGRVSQIVSEAVATARQTGQKSVVVDLD